MSDATRIPFNRDELRRLIAEAYRQREEDIEEQKDIFCHNMASRHPWYRRWLGLGPRWTPETARAQLEKSKPRFMHADDFEEFLYDMFWRSARGSWLEVDRLNRVLETDVGGEPIQVSLELASFLAFWGGEA